MTVIKKSGRKEEFSVEKLKQSLQAANTFTSEPLNINAVASEFQQIVKGKELITVQQIDVVVFGLLYACNAFFSSTLWDTLTNKSSLHTFECWYTTVVVWVPLNESAAT